MDISIGKLQVEHLSEVLKVERASFGRQAWPEENFRESMGQDGTYCLTAKVDDIVAGHMIFGDAKEFLHVPRLVVAPWSRRRGAGTMLVESLKERMLKQSRKSILIIVKESNLSAQLFLQTQGFVATDAKSNLFGEEDGIFMEYPRPDEPYHQPRWRIEGTEDGNVLLCLHDANPGNR